MSLSGQHIRCGSLSPVRGPSKENRTGKWPRRSTVHRPAGPGGVWGLLWAGNGRALAGSKGPYLLGRMNLKTGTNRPVKSQAVNWATAGLLAGPLACWPAFPAARRRQQPQAATCPELSMPVPPLRAAVDYVFIMNGSERARSLASPRTLPAASVLT